MPVKIEKGAKIGNNNAIGDNAQVKVETNHEIPNTQGLKTEDAKDNENKTWFGKHPWLSAIICSLIASVIMLLNWDGFFTFIKELF